MAATPDNPDGADLARDTSAQDPAAKQGMNARLARQSSESDEGRLRLADATRTVIQELVSSTASPEVLDEAASLIEDAIRLLAARPHGRGYDGPAEGSLAEDRRSFADNSPFIGLMNPLAPPMTIHPGDDEVVALVEFGDAYEGPPGCLHGGFIAAAFDEVLGFTQSLSGRAGMTGQLEVTYRSPTPLHRPLRFVGRVTGIEGRKILTHATLHAGDTLCAEATGLFVTMRPEVFDRLLRVRLEQPQEPTTPTA